MLIRDPYRLPFVIVLALLVIALSVEPLFFAMVPVVFCGGSPFLGCLGASAFFALPSALAIVLSSLALKNAKQEQRGVRYALFAALVAALLYGTFAYLGIAAAFLPFA